MRLTAYGLSFCCLFIFNILLFLFYISLSYLRFLPLSSLLSFFLSFVFLFVYIQKWVTQTPTTNFYIYTWYLLREVYLVNKYCERFIWWDGTICPGLQNEKNPTRTHKLYSTFKIFIYPFTSQIWFLKYYRWFLTHHLSSSIYRPRPFRI